MAEKPQSYYGAWINRQRSLLPGLDEELDPLTAKLEHLIIIVSVGCWPPTAVPASVRSLVCHSEARQVSINE